LNPHSLNGHRILSPACLPFHHPGIVRLSCRSCRSCRLCKSAIMQIFHWMLWLKILFQKTQSCLSDPVPHKRGFHHPGIVRLSCRSCRSCRLCKSAIMQIFHWMLWLKILFQKTQSCLSDPVPHKRGFHHPGIVRLSCRSCRSCRLCKSAIMQIFHWMLWLKILFQKTQSCLSDPVPHKRGFHHPGIVRLSCRLRLRR
jgi:hypothetical protein